MITFILLKQSSSAPKQKPAQEVTTSVRTLNIPMLDVIPKAIGYGTVRPVSIWEGIAQVEGLIIKTHPNLAKGSIIEKGSELLEIDPTNYQLIITQIEADILVTNAQLKELDIKQENTKISLEIEKKSLALTKKELSRLRNLLKKKSVSYSDFEGQERNMLSQQQNVLSQSNALNLIPSQKALLDAQLQQKEAQLKRAQRDLLYTKIKMPFTGRISTDNIENAQYVRVGNTLVAADDLSKAEIEVQIPIRYFRGLLHQGKPIDFKNPTKHQLQKKLNINAQIVLREGGLITRWDAHFSRLTDTLDPKTRTIGVIVEVDNPYDNVTPGRRPPLVKGFFVEVHLLGNPRKNSLVVPRSSLHNEQLYRINKDNRLEMVKVKIELYQADFAIVTGLTNNKQTPLTAGDKIVISDLVPAIEGMLLSPQDDKNMLKRLTHLVKQSTLVHTQAYPQESIN